MTDLPGQLGLWPEAHEEPAASATRPDADARTHRERSDAGTPGTPVVGLPDAAARMRIRTALDHNMLVEAGAGAGKTTEMVERMIALVRAGVEVTHIAAVTFTRKAAAELRERFQTNLEAALRAARADGDLDVVDTLDRALREIDRAFIGTIHSFCARLLRERPLDARLDPAFRELQASEQRQLEVEFWHRHLDRLAADGDEQLVDLDRAGMKPSQLFDLFHTLVEQPDVHFAASDVAMPDVVVPRRRLEEWLDAAERLMPSVEPEEGWDSLQTMVRLLRYHRHIAGWSDPADFLNALLELSRSAKPTQKRWAPDGGRSPAAKALGEVYSALMAPDGAVGHARDAWRAHRYPIALRFGLRAAHAFQQHREREGVLTFQDLLMLAARVLREHESARRELGDRYRHLLVDEFQDTDPIQAEVVFLLAAGADAPADEHGHADWTQATPRAGALFVVGDPKQSIYRFRRADIAIYNQVKHRLRAVGEVVELTANFRSVPQLADFANKTFRDRFEREETEHQAAFAPLDAQKAAVAERAVYWYALDDGGERGRSVMLNDDPELVASWVAERIARGERQAGDFLLLARMNRFLTGYARALEARGVPVQVTGGGVGIEAEVAELLVVLRALEDPGDPMKTLAALVGMFFGIDYEQLTSYVLGPIGAEHDRRRPLEFLKPIPDDDALARNDERLVAGALRKLQEWWRALLAEPADVAVGRIVDELGLLPHAAAGELGETRAGAVLFLLDALRAAAERGAASLTDALDALEAAYDEDEGEAPLRPGRSDVVRIMTLHKAKGLEAPVVMLVAPFGEWDAPIERVIVRGDDGRAAGWLSVRERAGHKVTVHAEPPDWEEHEARERAFSEAEDVRLLYVAATRAMHELVVAVPPEKVWKVSPWRALYAPLLEHGTELVLTKQPVQPRLPLDLPADEMQRRVALIDQRRASLARPSYRAAPVKLRAGELSDYEVHAARRGHGAAGRGVDWGSAVHGALEAAMHGAHGSALRDRCRSLLIATDRPTGADGEPAELDELVGIVNAVLGSPLWQRVQAADAVLVEAPFSLALTVEEYAAIARSIGVAAGDGAGQEIIEGVVDLAFRESGAWTVVDYKSDEAGSAIEAPRRAKYRAQVELYATAVERITGEAVAGRTLLFTADGAVETW
ncbi:MAG TPA: UvrD-helicase domain-containing protein [Longimicrobiales bacterium]